MACNSVYLPPELIRLTWVLEDPLTSRARTSNQHLLPTPSELLFLRLDYRHLNLGVSGILQQQLLTHKYAMRCAGHR
ncbi:unnamed protein product [Penicillium salamii]|uniref:Uncharacterized protein n=1 Tax=Penicillium salamii TaxID=1612424 RepID=A0A9W4IRG4_9EURO|nr:unnamed protein product [Penicillium salamii]